MLQRIYLASVITTLSGTAALAAFALKLPFTVGFACLCLAALSGFIGLWLSGKERAILEQSGTALGGFMRGVLSARLQPLASDDELSRLQHRVNNLLDVIDLHLRNMDAAIDFKQHQAYADKLRVSPLMELLARSAPPLELGNGEDEKKEKVGDFFKELQQSMEQLFTPNTQEDLAKAKPDAAPKRSVMLDTLRRSTQGITLSELRHDQTAIIRQLQNAAERLQASSAQLAQRAMKPAQPSPTTPVRRPSIGGLQQAFARLSEQANVVSLNVAIEAGRGEKHSSLQSAADELHGFAAQLNKLRNDLAVLGPANSEQAPGGMASVPLSFAVEALALAEQTLRDQSHAAHAVLERLAQLLDEPAEKAA